MDRTRRSTQKYKSWTILYQLDKIDTYRTFHSITAEYILFSSAHEMFSRMPCIGEEKIHNRFKRIEIIQRMFSD